MSSSSGATRRNRHGQRRHNGGDYFRFETVGSSGDGESAARRGEEPGADDGYSDDGSNAISIKVDWEPVRQWILFGMAHMMAVSAIISCTLLHFIFPMALSFLYIVAIVLIMREYNIDNYLGSALYPGLKRRLLQLFSCIAFCIRPIFYPIGGDNEDSGEAEDPANEDQDEAESNRAGPSPEPGPGDSNDERVSANLEPQETRFLPLHPAARGIWYVILVLSLSLPGLSYTFGRGGANPGEHHLMKYVYEFNMDGVPPEIREVYQSSPDQLTPQEFDDRGANTACMVGNTIYSASPKAANLQPEESSSIFMEGGGDNFLLALPVKNSKPQMGMTRGEKVRLVPSSAKSWMRNPLYLNAINSTVMCFTSQWTGEFPPNVPTINKRYSLYDSDELSNAALFLCGNKETGFRGQETDDIQQYFVPRSFTVLDGKLWFLQSQVIDGWWRMRPGFDSRCVGTRAVSLDPETMRTKEHGFPSMTDGKEYYRNCRYGDHSDPRCDGYSELAAHVSGTEEYPYLALMGSRAESITFTCALPIFIASIRIGSKKRSPSMAATLYLGIILLITGTEILNADADDGGGISLDHLQKTAFYLMFVASPIIAIIFGAILILRPPRVCCCTDYRASLTWAMHGIVLVVVMTCFARFLVFHEGKEMLIGFPVLLLGLLGMIFGDSIFLVESACGVFVFLYGVTTWSTVNIDVIDPDVNPLERHDPVRIVQLFVATRLLLALEFLAFIALIWLACFGCPFTCVIGPLEEEDEQSTDMDRVDGGDSFLDDADDEDYESLRRALIADDETGAIPTAHVLGVA